MANSHAAPLSAKPNIISLYALGSNGNYQLGLPHNEDTNLPQRCIFNVTHTPPLNTSPSTSQHEQHTPSSSTPTTQTRIPLYPDETIQDLKAGGNHTLLLTTHGRVFAAGSNEHGQLARLPPSPSPLPSSLSTALPTTPGFHLLPWTGPSPNHPITHITATFTATMLVSQHTTLYVAGHGPKGELALGSTVMSSPVPTRAFDIRDTEGPEARITAMAACMDHVLLSSSTGVVYGFGASRKGQLGESLRQQGVVWKVTTTDMHVGLPFRVAQIATGRDFSVVAGWREKEVRAFGKGSDVFNGALRWTQGDGASGLSDGRELERLEQENDGDMNTETIELHAGWSSVTIQHRGVQCNYLAGCLMKDIPGSTSTNPSSTSTPSTASPQSKGQPHDRGQLPPAGLPSPYALAVGSEHSIAILDDAGVQKVVSWGWGEHGNCGSTVDDRGVVGGGKWNVLFHRSWKKVQKQGQEAVDVEMGIRGVGAGCGSSFFWVEEVQTEGEQIDEDSGLEESSAEKV